MKKLVNGNVIDISNIKLFELGFEGLVLNQKASSDVKTPMESNSNAVKRYINAYNKVINGLPFPLYAIESDCKYAIIANYMLNKIPELDSKKVHINKCIIIELDDSQQLKLMYKTWAIEKKNEKFDGFASLDLNKYSKCTEYKELKWCYDKMVADQSIGSYYKEFMKEFIEACGGNPMVLNWELKNILNFGYVPDEMKIDKNRIIYPSKGYEYFLDIFCTGKKPSKDSILEIDLTENGKVTQKHKSIKVYDFEIYGKRLSTDSIMKETDNKLEKKKFDGMANVFETIISLGISNDMVENIEYRGIMDEDVIIFEANNKIYGCDPNKYGNTDIIASNVSIYGYEDGRVYLKNSIILESGVHKDSIYAYDTKTNKARLCKIRFKL